ncbi:MAG: hypothetical protein J6J42_08270 [Lachnospiraceae bacterium]|nr:hypothetical protein [Lachnospiraceae bacterium]
MKNIAELLKGTIHYFFIITVLVLVVTAGYISFFWGIDAQISVAVLWQILLVSFLGSLSNIIFATKKNRMLGRLEFWLRWAGCYLYVNMVVLGFGSFFQWFDRNSLPMVVGMLIAIGIVFLIVAVVVFQVDKKTSDEINRILKQREEKNGTEEEEDI